MQDSQAGYAPSREDVNRPLGVPSVRKMAPEFYGASATLKARSFHQCQHFETYLENERSCRQHDAAHRP